MPLLSITTPRKIPDHPKIVGDLRVYRCDAARPTNDGLRLRVAIEERGSSTKAVDKRSYDLEFRTDDARERSVPLLGMAAESDWVLHACYYDKTCLRNVLAYRLARKLGRWAPDTRFAELYLNGRYKGLYVVVEKIKRSAVRVDIAAGGYIVRREGGGGRGKKKDWTSKSKEVWSYHYPRFDRITHLQREELQSAIDGLTSSLEREPQALDKIDVRSWVDFALLQEFGNNVDAYFRSVYLHADTMSPELRFVAGPVWDFDLAFGNADFRDGWRTDVWAYEANARSPSLRPVPRHWERLWCNPAFRIAATARWQELRASWLTEDWLTSNLKRWAVEIESARERDDEVWQTVGAAGWPSRFIGDSFSEEVAWLSQWVVSRLRWLDSHLPETSCRGRPRART